METKEFNIEDLRRQYSLLQQKVESQQIVNDRLLRESMSRRQSWSRNVVYLEIFVGLPLSALFIGDMLAHGAVSIWPVLALVPLLIADIAFDYRMNVLGRDAFNHENLMQTARRLVRYQKITKWQTLIAAPLSILWFIWVILDIMAHHGVLQDHDAMVGGLIGGCAGIVAGILVVWYIVRRILRDRQEIIDQIREVEAGEPLEAAE